MKYHNPNHILVGKIKRMNKKCCQCFEMATALYHKNWVCREHFHKMKQHIDLRRKVSADLNNENDFNIA